VTFLSLRKRAAERDADDVLEDVEPEETAEDGAGQDQEPEGHYVPGLLPALYQGVCGWCAWCAGRIGVGLTWTVHGFALYAAGRYDGWVTCGVAGGFTLATLLFTPRETFERLATRLDAVDAARAARLAPPNGPGGEPVEEAADEPPTDPLPPLVWRLIGEGSGVHLKTLTAVLAEAAVKGGQRPPSKADVEAALEARRIPLRDSVRDARKKVNRGVHRNDLEAWAKGLSPAEPADPATGS
jgi:hypothetical protein